MSQGTIQHLRKGDATYYQYSDRAVACSSEVCDGVIADFDEKGGLRGIEVLVSSVLEETSIEDLARKAKARSHGRKPIRRVAIPEL